MSATAIHVGLFVLSVVAVVTVVSADGGDTGNLQIKCNIPRRLINDSRDCCEQINGNKPCNDDDKIAQRKETGICISKLYGTVNEDGTYNHEKAIEAIKTSQKGVDEKIVNSLVEAANACDKQETEVYDKLECFGKKFRDICIE